MVRGVQGGHGNADLLWGAVPALRRTALLRTAPALCPCRPCARAAVAPPPTHLRCPPTSPQLQNKRVQDEKEFKSGARKLNDRFKTYSEMLDHQVLRGAVPGAGAGPHARARGGPRAPCDSFAPLDPPPLLKDWAKFSSGSS